MAKKPVEKEVSDTTAVLIHIPNSLYTKYIKSVEERSLKRQHYNTKLFCEAIQKDLDTFETGA